MKKVNHKFHDRRRVIYWALAVFLAALIIRLVVIVPWTPKIIDDQVHYLKLAESLAEGCAYTVDGTVDTYCAPLYPAFLAVIYYLTSGDPYRATTIIQSFLSALTCVIIFLLAWDTWGERIGLTAGIIAIVAPDLILYNAWLLTETLFIFLVALLLWCVYKIGDKLQGWIIAGILLGLCALTRPTFLLFLPILFFWLYFSKKVKLYKLLMIPLITFVVITPWTVRNYTVTGSFMLVSSAGGINLWIGNNENGTGEYRWIEEGNPYMDDTLSEAEKNSKCYSEVIRFVSQNPVKASNLLVLKAILFIIPTGDKFYIASNYLQPTVMFFLTGLFFEFLLLGAVGVVFSKSNKGTSLFWSFIVSVFGGVLIFFFQERFRITTYLTLIPLAAAGWASLSHREQRKRKVIIVTLVLVIQLVLGLIALVLRPDYIQNVGKIFT